MQVSRPVGWAIKAAIVAAVAAVGWYAYPRVFGGGGGDPSVVRLSGVAVDTRTPGKARIYGLVRNTGAEELAMVELAVDCLAGDDSGHRETLASVGGLHPGQERTFSLEVRLPPPAAGRAYHPHCDTRVASVTPAAH